MNHSDTSRKTWSLPWRTALIATVVAVCAATIVIPAQAGSPPPTAPLTTAQIAKYTGMGAALPTVMGAAPADFRQQLQTYLQSVNATQPSYSNLSGAASLSSQAKAALPLLAAANDHDLAFLHFVLSYLNNWQQQPKQLVKMAHLVKVAKAWRTYHSLPAGSPQAKLLAAHYQFGSDCPAGAPIWLVIALQGAKEIFDIIDEFIDDSKFESTFPGNGLTLPISPDKIITSIIKIVLSLAYDAAQASYDVNGDCLEDEHEKQVDQHNQYSRAMNQQKTLTIHVTALDTYHYQFSVQFEGQPADPTNETLQALYLPTTCTAPPTTPGNCTNATDITGNVTFQRLDTGLYQFQIPTVNASSAYRLKIEFDNGQDVNGNTLAYYGDVAFTKANQ